MLVSVVVQVCMAGPYFATSRSAIAQIRHHQCELVTPLARSRLSSGPPSSVAFLARAAMLSAAPSGRPPASHCRQTIGMAMSSAPIGGDALVRAWVMHEGGAPHRYNNAARHTCWVPGRNVHHPLATPTNFGAVLHFVISADGRRTYCRPHPLVRWHVYELTCVCVLASSDMLIKICVRLCVGVSSTLWFK